MTKSRSEGILHIKNEVLSKLKTLHLRKQAQLKQLETDNLVATYDSREAITPMQSNLETEYKQ